VLSKWLKAKVIKQEYSLSEKRLRQLRDQGLVTFKQEGNCFLYSRESIEAYFSGGSVAAKPQIRYVERHIPIQRKEVNFKSLKGGAAMPKWVKEIGKDGGPNGRCRLNCGDFSLIECQGKKRINYYMDFIDGNGKRHTQSLKRLASRLIRDRADAFELARRIRNRMYEEESAQENSNATFSEFVPIYLDGIHRRQLRTSDHIEMIVTKRLEPFFGEMKLCEIKYRHAEQYRNYRQDEGVDNSTIHYEISWARAMYNEAARKEYVNAVNPFQPGQLDLRVNQRERYMTIEEQERLWPVLEKHPPLKDLATFILNTGMRPKNIIMLEWDQILWKERIIRVPKEQFKNKRKDGRFYINDTVMEMLERLKAVGKSQSHVFVRVDDFGRIRRITHCWYQEKWRRACKEAGVEDLRFYELKHTLGTRMAAAGKNAFTIQKIMNHAQISSTQRYVKSDQDANIEALKSMDEILNGVKKGVKK
jgi:integrase